MRVRDWQPQSRTRIGEFVIRRSRLYQNVKFEYTGLLFNAADYVAIAHCCDIPLLMDDQFTGIGPLHNRIPDTEGENFWIDAGMNGTVENGELVPGQNGAAGYPIADLLVGTKLIHCDIELPNDDGFILTVQSLSGAGNSISAVLTGGNLIVTAGDFPTVDFTDIEAFTGAPLSLAMTLDETTVSVTLTTDVGPFTAGGALALSYENCTHFVINMEAVNRCSRVYVEEL